MQQVPSRRIKRASAALAVSPAKRREGSAVHARCTPDAREDKERSDRILRSLGSWGKQRNEGARVRVGLRFFLSLCGAAKPLFLPLCAALTSQTQQNTPNRNSLLTGGIIKLVGCASFDVIPQYCSTVLRVWLRKLAYAAITYQTRPDTIPDARLYYVVRLPLVIP